MPRKQGLEIEVQVQSRDRGIVRDAAAELADLPYVRLTQRVQPPPERRNLWLLLGLVLLAHVLLGWLTWRVLRPSPMRHGEGGVIAVMLIEPARNSPPPPPLVEPPPLPGQLALPPRRLHYVPPAKGAIQAEMQGVKGPPLELYESNGQIRLPPHASRQAAPAPAYSAPALQGSQIYSGKSPVPYKPTRFNKDWAPDHESLGAETVGRAVDKAIEKTTVQKTVRLPGGAKIHCAVSPLMLLAGCRGDDPQPPPGNDDDIRLSMPPAETLTGKKVVVPTPASSAAKPATAPAREGNVKQDQRACRLQSQDAQTASHSRDACRERQPLPAGGRS